MARPKFRRFRKPRAMLGKCSVHVARSETGKSAPQRAPRASSCGSPTRLTCRRNPGKTDTALRLLPPQDGVALTHPDRNVDPGELGTADERAHGIRERETMLAEAVEDIGHRKRNRAAAGCQPSQPGSLRTLPQAAEIEVVQVLGEEQRPAATEQAGLNAVQVRDIQDDETAWHPPFTAIAKKEERARA